jgi:hypothetical protein
MLTVDASSLGDKQSCLRKFVLGLSWRAPRWRPKALWDACLLSGILSIVQDGVLPAAAAAASRLAFLQAAADPGLDITVDPYRAAQDWCAMLETVLRSLAREGLPQRLTEHPPVPLSLATKWAPLAHVEDRTLHRWVSVDHWTQNNLARELHSWRTLGDIAATKLPMMIHVVEIGQMRAGRRFSSWVRAWKHPAMPSLQMRFKGKTPGALKSWRPFYLSDSHITPDDWTEQLWKEGAAKEMLHHVQVKVPTDEQCAAVVLDILTEALEMETLKKMETPWNGLPMSRNACDGMVPCPFQNACYSEGLVRLDNLFRPASIHQHPSEPVRPSVRQAQAPR